IVSGFFELARAGSIDLTVRTGEAVFGLTPLVSAVIDGRTRVIYDTHDGYNFLDSSQAPAQGFDFLLEEYDLWFKYTCVETINAKLRNHAKVRPLGLISGFFGSHHNPYDVGLWPLELRQAARTLVGTSSCLSSITSANSRHLWPEQYETGPVPGDGRALFIAGAWDPAAPEVSSEQIRQERFDLNEYRAGLVRSGREALKERFVGGLQRSAFAELHYPDCIYDGPEATNRWAYLKTLRHASVGIASSGLHGCAGGKLAEYVAASRGVVTTPLGMILPGEFAAGLNYVAASTPEDSIDCCRGLLDDLSRLTAMMSANGAYYEAYVRPSACVRNTIRVALGED
ncbi:MAG: hypothetical protein Q8S43_04820, partial [Actinomycetota bacterium]|nr:hypothetical protein [Actinomycetota bacterium]